MRIFITHILPRKDVMSHHLSVAGCNFCWNLIEGGVFDKVYSILPPFIQGKLDVEYDDLVYSNWREASGWKRKMAAIKEQYLVFKKIPRGASVWFYNMTLINCVLFALLRLFKRSVKVNVIILDYTPDTRRFSLQNMMLWLCNKAHGTITLADSALFTCKNTCLLPGVVPLGQDVHPKIEQISNEFLISGMLREEISLISMLLETFSKMPNCILHITGFCDDTSLIEQYAQKYDNIVFHGKVEYPEYVRLLETVPFLLSTRDPKAPENQCNFPSKIIEALLYNRMVVSTIPYKQLADINYILVSSECNQFVRDISNVISHKEQLMGVYANQASKVINLFNTEVWKTKMEEIERNDVNTQNIIKTK